MRKLGAILATIAAVSGLGYGLAAAATSDTGTNVSCATATASLPAHTVGVDGSDVDTISGTQTTAADCETQTYTIPTTTETDTATVTQTVTAPTSGTTSTSSTTSSQTTATQTTTSSQTSSPTCLAAANTPGGSDPWGGCFPGPTNTGVPAGTTLTPVSTNGETAAQAVKAGAPADNTGWTYVAGDDAIYVTTTGAVIDAVKTPGVEENIPKLTVTVKDSEIDGVISSNLTNGLITLSHDTINGGKQDGTPTVGIDNVDIESSNVQGGKDELNCEGGQNCMAQDSYLANESNANVGSPHQQGVFVNGADTVILRHDTIGCNLTAGQCTADVSILNGGADTNITASNNLLLTDPNFEVYPGPDAAQFYATLHNVTWANNVFQRGSNGHGGGNGPVYGWFPSWCNTTANAPHPSNAQNTSCSFAGNEWDDGSALTQSFQ